jgi:hypothetical protein
MRTRVEAMELRWNRNAWLIIVGALAVVSCGSVGRVSGSHPSATPGAPYVAPGAPTPDPQGPTFLTVVLKPGADPVTVGNRIAGPDATVRQAPQIHQENLPLALLRRTYRVNLIRGQEIEALKRGRTDPEVTRAYFGEYPGQYPEP